MFLEQAAGGWGMELIYIKLRSGGGFGGSRLSRNTMCWCFSAVSLPKNNENELYVGAAELRLMRMGRIAAPKLAHLNVM
jgi:hypothetical protein